MNKKLDAHLISPTKNKMFKYDRSCLTYPHSDEIEYLEREAVCPETNLTYNVHLIHSPHYYEGQKGQVLHQ